MKKPVSRGGGGKGDEKNPRNKTDESGGTKINRGCYSPTQALGVEMFDISRWWYFGTLVFSMKHSTIIDAHI
jgi:hypothetical protein